MSGKRNVTVYRGDKLGNTLYIDKNNLYILICKKSCYSTGRVKFFIETFRALGVARGHSVTN